MTEGVEIFVGIKDIQSKSFAVIPNPAKDFVTVDSEGLIRVEMFDLQGRMLSEYANIKDILRIDLKTFESGIYLIKMYSETKTIVTHRLTIVK